MTGHITNRKDGDCFWKTPNRVTKLSDQSSSLDINSPRCFSTLINAFRNLWVVSSRSALTGPQGAGVGGLAVKKRVLSAGQPLLLPGASLTGSSAQPLTTYLLGRLLHCCASNGDIAAGVCQSLTSLKQRRKTDTLYAAGWNNTNILTAFRQKAIAGQKRSGSSSSIDPVPQGSYARTYGVLEYWQKESDW